MMGTVNVTTDATRPKAEGAPRRIVDLRSAEATDAALVGGKAAGLARAAAAGFDVPRGFVITTAAGTGPLDLDAWLAPFGDAKFAVRSSAVAEDSGARSFAGQLETLLGVAPADVPAAVARCRASAEALRVLRYAGSPGATAVLVQELVPAECAGVAFTAHPVSGERGVTLVEAVRGLGDRLVGGEVSAEAWRATSDGAVLTRAVEAPVLDRALVERIAALARELETLFGRPQDVEWAVAGGAVRLLQSRPITALPAPPVPLPVEVPEGRWERDDHHAVLSPLGWTWFAPYPKAMARSLGAFLPLKDVLARNVGGHLYLQMVMEGGDGAPPPRWVLWLVSRLIPAMRRANEKCVELLDGETYLRTIDEWESEGRRAMRDATDALYDPDPTALSNDELLACIRRALEHSGRGLEKHSDLHMPGFLALGKLLLFIEDELGWEPTRVLELVTGSSTETTELHRSLEQLLAEADVDAALGDSPFPATWGELFARFPALGARLSEWYAAHHLRILHYDPKHATLGEQPEVVLGIVAAIAEGRRSPRPPQRSPAEPLLAEARERLAPDRFAEFERLVGHARRGYALRDENGIETVSRPSGLLRHYVLELGRRLPLEAREHAVYLLVEEHGPALRGEIPDLAARVAKRRGEESWALENRGPRYLGGPPDAMPPVDAFPSGLARVLRVFSWVSAAEALPTPAEGDGPLTGIGIGSRVVTARARVVSRPEELAALRHGEVLVCRITSPEWSIALGRVAAIVTNEGALLSHPAIIAREYGLTAVLGTSTATTRIATGDRVRVDPVEATVTIVSRAGAS